MGKSPRRRRHSAAQSGAWLLACRAWACGPRTVMKTVAESPQHLNKWTTVVEVEAAVDESRPLACLIRSVRLNERVRVADAGNGRGGSAKWCLIFSGYAPHLSPEMRRDGSL